MAGSVCRRIPHTLHKRHMMIVLVQDVLVQDVLVQDVLVQDVLVQLVWRKCLSKCRKHGNCKM